MITQTIKVGSIWLGALFFLFCGVAHADDALRVKGTRYSFQLMQAYANYNWQYFEGKLPREMPVCWAEGIKKGKTPLLEAVIFGKEAGGKDEPQAILVDQRLGKYSIDYAFVLVLHAMNHIATEATDDDEKFQVGMRRLAAAGAFDGLW
jgi:hypothetical protein